MAAVVPQSIRLVLVNLPQYAHARRRLSRYFAVAIYYLLWHMDPDRVLFVPLSSTLFFLTDHCQPRLNESIYLANYV